MFRKSVFKQAVVITAATLVVLAPASRADGWGWGHRSHREPVFTRHFAPPGRVLRHMPGDFLRLMIGGLELYYCEGMFYRMQRDQYLVVPAPVGAVVTTIPQGAQTVIVDGVPYYSVNGVTYMSTPYGYQVVPAPRPIVINTPSPPPAPAAEPPAVSDTTYTVNIPNARGGYTAVTLRRSGSGFVGPQGEFYTEFPRVDQLKTMYGR
jgi:hypothetical protein